MSHNPHAPKFEVLEISPEISQSAVGPYDDGYRECPCFWGEAPSSLVVRLREWLPSLQGLRVLDAGCGEGKNAIYFAAGGAKVEAIDASALAIRNARQHWGEAAAVSWTVGDVRATPLDPSGYDVIVAYGLFHCMSAVSEIESLIRKLREATRPGGLNVVCTFNSRSQDLSAHPGFHPTLVAHSWYVERYADWELLEVTDADLAERHPHNNAPHTHSMTRILARSPR